MKVLGIFVFSILMGVCFGGSSKRKMMMTGGWSEVKDLSAPHIQKYAKLAAETLVADINSDYHLKLMNVTHAQQQVVSGMNYKINLAIAPSECLKSGNYTKEQIDACPLQQCDNPLNCSAKVWAQEWLQEDPIKISETKCQRGESFC